MTELKPRTEDMLRQRLGSLAESVTNLNSRMWDLKGHLFGSQVSEVERVDKEPPIGFFGEVIDSIESIQTTISFCSDCISQMEDQFAVNETPPKPGRAVGGHS